MYTGYVGVCLDTILRGTTLESTVQDSRTMVGLLVYCFPATPEKLAKVA